MFSEEHFKKLPPHRGKFDCAINLKEEATIPKAARPIPLSNTLILELTKHIQEEKGDHKIRDSELPTAAACFYVPKKDGSC